MGKLKLYKTLSGIFMILAILMTGLAVYAIYLLTGIETFYRFIIAILLLLGLVTCIYSLLDSVKYYKSKKFIISSVFSIILIIIGFIVSFIIFSVYLKISGFNQSEIMYRTALISLEKQASINNLENIKIGYIDDKEDIVGNILPIEVIEKYDLDKKNKIVEYSDTVTLMSALINKEVDAIFISSNYQSMFKNIDGLKEGQELYEIAAYEKKYKKEEVEPDTNENVTKLTDPFTVLLLGVDEAEDGKINGSFNGDTIMLITFDPETLHATMFSIPRDTYVTMACGGNITKINHAAWGGTSCMVKTVEKFTGIKIDYYAKINFKGVIDLVNNIGGITVDVPMDFCESNSDRLVGPDYEICLKKGVQKLNGEQALALARHRKTLPLGDFQRGQNQQLVVEGMINQIKTLRSVSDFYSVLNTVSKNIDTNMSTDEILSFYNIGKSILMKDEDVSINITKTFLTGYDLYVYEGSGYSYTFQYYKQSLDSIINAMKVNLKQIEQEEIKTFSFNINEPYEKTIIGKKYYNETRKSLIPNFKEYSIGGAESWASSHGFTINIEYAESSNDSYYDGQIIGQSVHEGVLVDKAPKTITISVVKKVEGGSTVTPDPKPETPTTPDPKPETPDPEEGENNPSEGNNTGEGNNDSDNEENSNDNED